MHKQFCEQCQYNFANQTMFFSHRVGQLSRARRCLTVEEMTEKGWILRTLLVDQDEDGYSVKEQMATWTTKELLARDERFRQVGSIGTFRRGNGRIGEQHRRGKE